MLYYSMVPNAQGLRHLPHPSERLNKMVYNVQKASIWKRISAFLFDGIILGIMAVALAWLLSGALGFDTYNQMLDQRYEAYASQYGISFEISQEEYEALEPEEKSRHDEAYAALARDEEATYAYNMVVSLSLVIITVSVLAAFLALEFAAPLLIGNGQTMGKRIFGVALMRNDGVRINAVSLFVRTVLGKFTIETMIPLLIILMIFWGVIGVISVIILGVILLAQLLLLAFSRNNLLIHDFLANTIAVDYASQMIFADDQALIDYKKRLAAEKSARQNY